MSDSGAQGFALSDSEVHSEVCCQRVVQRARFAVC